MARASTFRTIRRVLARAISPDHTRRFDAAGGGRRWEHRPHFGNSNSEALAGGPAILPRARHAVANNGWAANAVSTYETALIGAGIESILNFAPVVITVPRGVSLRKVDLAVELQILSFYQSQREPRRDSA